jgi:transcriptional regulator with XRE-family HTH domain
MKFTNLEWAIKQRGSQFRFAAQLGQSESWLSRRLTGRSEFKTEDQRHIAELLGYPTEWLFQVIVPPTFEPDSSLLGAA